MIRAALSSLARDGWVLGIAAAAGVAYATIRLTEATIAFALQFIEGQRVFEDPGLPEGFFDPPFTFVVNGRYVSYGELVQAAVLFVVVFVVATAIVHATRPQDDDHAAD